jgi:predicted flap endonuclease-1-like 5' DNA nuclease
MTAIRSSDELPPAIGKPALRALIGAGIRTLAQVTRWTEHELLALHGVGPKAINILKSALAEQGASLRGS